jgi:hypothetical protein
LNDTTATGRIINISTSGCAIGSASMSPPVDMEITIKMTLNGKDNSLHEFMIIARIVRMSLNEFAVEFQDIEDDPKELLLNLLLQETEREL